MNDFCLKIVIGDTCCPYNITVFIDTSAERIFFKHCTAGLICMHMCRNGQISGLSRTKSGNINT